MFEGQSNRRLHVLLWLLLGWSGLVFARLVSLQVIHHDDLLKQAQQQQQRMREIPALRGTILDRSGQTLAKSMPVESVCVNPQRIPDAGTATRLSLASVAVWWVAFSIPLFRSVPEPAVRIEPYERPGGNALVAGVKRLLETFQELRRYRECVDWPTCALSVLELGPCHAVARLIADERHLLPQARRHLVIYEGKEGDDAVTTVVRGRPMPR